MGLGNECSGERARLGGGDGDCDPCRPLAHPIKWSPRLSRRNLPERNTNPAGVGYYINTRCKT